MDVQKAVEAGAKLLDEKHEGWHRKIDVSKLQMNDCVQCVLGQLYENFRQGYEVLDETGGPISGSIRLGFDAEPFVEGGNMYAALNQFWKEEIQRRLDKGATS